MNWAWVLAALLFYGGLYALYYFLKKFVGSTVEKSIAHQFDIKLELFKQDFNRELHAEDRKDKYRLAALDKRLAAHQKAFKFSRKMVGAINATERIQKELVVLWEDLWDNESLYLSNDVRNALANAYYEFVFMEEYDEEIRSNKGDIVRIKDVQKEKKDAISLIRRLPNTIVESVDLESIAKGEINIDQDSNIKSKLEQIKSKRKK